MNVEQIKKDTNKKYRTVVYFRCNLVVVHKITDPALMIDVILLFLIILHL